MDGCENGVCTLDRSKRPLVTRPPLPAPEESRWTVYGAAWCPFCRRATEFLDAHEADYASYDLDDYGGRSAVQATLGELVPAEHTTIPIVFDRGEFVGGYTQLVEAVENVESAKVIEPETSTTE